MGEALLRPSLILGAFVVSLLAFVYHKVRQIGSRPFNFVPGPPTEPIWGNIRQIGNSLYPQHQYTEWAKQYGPVYSIMKGNTTWLVVSGAAEAQEIFNKRGQVTAGRPENKFELLMRDGWFPAFMGGNVWRAARKMWHSILNVGAARQYLPYQMLETKKLMYDICEEPGAWRMHTDRFANSLAMTMMNGQRVIHNEDPSIQEVIRDLFDFSILKFKSSWMEHLPFLYNLPEWAVPAIREAKQVASKHSELRWRHWNTTKARVAKGMVLPSFTQAIMSKMQKGEATLPETGCTEVSESLLTAATDTTASTMNNWVGGMILFPQVQRKAQEEIDRVVGPDRMPLESDAVNLPYVRQMIQELQRWITVVPLGVSHATTAPMKWGTHDIPPGTGLILNTYAIHSNPTVYPCPRALIPERWAGKVDSALSLSDDQIGARSELFNFGAGRRICPGQHLAERSLFLAIANWLWAFDIRPATDEQGRHIRPDMDDLRPGIVATLNTFRADVRPRSEAKRTLMRQAWTADREALLDGEQQWASSPEGVASVMKKAVGRY